MCTHALRQSLSPLADSRVNDSLLQIIPHFNDALIQLVDVTYTFNILTAARLPRSCNRWGSDLDYWLCVCCFMCRLYSCMDCLFSFYARPYVLCNFHSCNGVRMSQWTKGYLTWLDLFGSQWSESMKSCVSCCSSWMVLRRDVSESCLVKDKRVACDTFDCWDSKTSRYYWQFTFRHCSINKICNFRQNLRFLAVDNFPRKYSGIR